MVISKANGSYYIWDDIPLNKQSLQILNYQYLPLFRDLNTDSNLPRDKFIVYRRINGMPCVRCGSFYVPGTKYKVKTGIYKIKEIKEALNEISKNQ